MENPAHSAKITPFSLSLSDLICGSPFVGGRFGGSEKMGFLSNKISRDEVKPGDHIYSWRQAYVYAHHGIYVGDGQVNHFTRGDGQETGTGTFLDKILVSSSHNHGDNPCPNCGDRSKLGGVISSCLECFLAGGDLYVFEYSVSPAIFLAKPRGGICTIASSDPPEEAIYRANFLLQYGFGVYNVFKNNCEDFAIYCKTGLLVANTDVGRSGQAATMVAAASVLLSSPLRLVAGFGGLAVAGCGMYCVGRLVSDIGMRWDASKVPVERLVADEVDKSEMEAKPVAEMEAKTVADVADKSEMEAKPVADAADKSEMEAKPEDKKTS